METKIFNGKQIKIRQLSKKDLINVKRLQDFINFLIEEGAQILFNRKFSIKEERNWIEKQLKRIRNYKTVLLIAEDNDKIVGTIGINLKIGRQSHIGEFGITIIKGHRGVGLGSYLIDKIIKLAKKELKPRPKFIRLNIFSTNKPAIELYKKFGFKIAAKIPKQFEFKRKLVNELIMLREI